jgi:hypothetical protein
LKSLDLSEQVQAIVDLDFVSFGFDFVPPVFDFAPGLDFVPPGLDFDAAGLDFVSRESAGRLGLSLPAGRKV